MQNTEIRIQGIRIVGVPWDNSGYAVGLRKGWLPGLVKAGVPFWIHPVSFEKDRPDLTTVPFDKTNPMMGSMHDMLDGFCRNQRPYDINFVRLSPEVGVNFLDSNSINILSTAWEYDKLSPRWTECCNKFDAIFVESQFAVDVFKNSGVKPPVYCVPNSEDVLDYKPKGSPNLKGTYKFYSIQQWTERKNGVGLLKAYFNAFSPEDDVLLVLKTYITRMEENQNQREIIKEHITNLKKSLNMIKPYPPVFLITDKLTDEEIVKMHEECDCYVMLDRGESWGIPYASASAAGNAIIGTNWGGSRQFLNADNSYPVNFQLTYSDNMLWGPDYHGEMKCADACLPHASELMRHVYDNREEAFEIGKKARQTMEQYYNQEVVTKTLLGAIADVVAKKRGIA